MIISNNDSNKTDVQKTLEIAQKAIDRAINEFEKLQQLIDTTTGKIQTAEILTEERCIA